MKKRNGRKCRLERVLALSSLHKNCLMHAAQTIHKLFSSGFVHWHQSSKACNRKLSWPINIAKEMYFQQKKTINQKHIVTNLLLRTHHFFNVVLELDFLPYCSTDEYPEQLDRLIIFNTYLITPYKCGRCSSKGQDIKCYAQQIIFLICSAHSIPFRQGKKSYFPLRPEPN